jgi:two-component system, LytTR family, response regulator
MAEIRALIVDDEPLARRGIRQLLAPYRDVTVVGECRDGREAARALATSDADLVFLDVQMPGLDGFDVVDALEPGKHPDIVFVTAYDRYAVRAFDVHAVDYLLKPFERARLRKALERLSARSDSREAGRRVHAAVESVRAQRPLRRVLIKASGRIYAVRVEDIDYIEVAGHYVELHTGATTHLVRDTIGSMEARLDSSRFVRIHRSVIVKHRPDPRAATGVSWRVRRVAAHRSQAAVQPQLCGQADEGDGVLTGPQRVPSKTCFPPTTVMRTRTAPISSAGISKMLRSSMTKSASHPFDSTPLRASSKEA